MVGTAAPSILDVADDELALRVCGPTRYGQIVRLQSRKCTIGSGPRCTLRLRARGVQPLHCLILRGPEATVIRRYSADTRINGQPFADAPLTPGDRLSVGPIEFEVVDADQIGLGEADPAQQGSPRPAAPARPEADQRQTDLDERRRALDRRQKALDEQSERVDRARAELESERQAFDQQRKSWEAERAESASDSSQESDVADARLAELDSQREAFEQERKQWEKERTEAEQTLAGRQEKLEARRAELESQRQAFEQERKSWEAERAESASASSRESDAADARPAELESQPEVSEQERNQWEEEVAEVEQTLTSRREELEAWQQALQNERQQWTDQQGEALKKLHARADDVDHRHADLDRVREEFEHQRAQYDAQRAEAERELRERSEELAERAEKLDARENEIRARQSEPDSLQGGLDPRQAKPAAAGEDGRESPRPADQPQDVQHEQPAGGSPGGTGEVLSRMGIAPSIDDGEDKDAGAPSEPQEAHTPDTLESPQESPAEEDESIDDYMSRLLERVRQTPGPGSRATRPDPAPQEPEPEPEPEPPQTPPQPSDSPSPAMESTDSPAPSPAPVSPPPEPDGASPRALAPERSADLSAMRDVANLSAHAAIDRYYRKILFSKSAGKLMVAMVALAASAALLWVWWAKSPGALPLYAGVASLGVSLFFGGQYLQLGTRLLFVGRGRAKRSQSNGDAEVDQQQKDETAPQAPDDASGQGSQAQPPERTEASDSA